MSKRTSSSSSRPKPKKAKIAVGQSCLERFFSSPTSDVARTGRKTVKTGSQGMELKTLPETSDTRKIIDVDLFHEESSSTLSTKTELGPSTPSAFRSPKVGSSTEDQLDAATNAKPAFFTPNPLVTPVYNSLSMDPLVFVLDDEPWPYNTPAPYSFLSHTLATLSKTRSRILIINTLTNALRTISRHHPASLLPALYLLSNSLSPPYVPIELGLGSSVVSKAIQQVSGLTPAALKRLYNTTGDVGDVAFEAKSNLRTLIPHPPLLIITVFDSLLKIARSNGQGTTKHMQGIVEKLLVAAKGEEVRFLTRTLSMNLRVGAVRTSILTALARAMVLTPPGTLSVPIPSDSPYNATSKLLSEVEDVPASPMKKNSPQDRARNEVNEKFGRAESLVKKVFVQHPNYDHIVAALLDAGLDGLAERVPLTVGIPLHPTLGSPTRSLDEIYDRLGDLPFTAECKLDGQRAQVHVIGSATSDGRRRAAVQIFSRHLEDMTTKYPDIVSLMQEIFAANPELCSFIIDSEIVAIDPVNGTLKTFQELSNRARKDVQIHDVKVAVGIFAFDLMYLDGEILLEQPFRKRRALLRKRLPPFYPKQDGIARFDHVESCESEDGREGIEEFWVKAVESRCEGLMIKLLDSGGVLEEPTTKKDKHRRKPLPATYEPDKRTSAWLKLKKDYVKGLCDSLDLVPIGAWHGNGRKAQWWSPVLLALRDGSTGRLVAVCKCMSGFTDDSYKAMRERYTDDSDTCSRQNLWDVDTGGLKPEVYFKPSEVWEIRGADVTLSPVSIAARGLVSDSRGLSLRFPRFIKVRDDKSIEDASDPEFLAQMWKDQQGKGSDQNGADDGELLDVDFEEQVEGDDSDF